MLNKTSLLFHNKICVSIGYPISSSKSPSLHTIGYKALGIEDQYMYFRAEVKPKDLKMAVEGVRGLGIRGVSVTMPLKEKIMKYLDKIDEDAKKIGAVNTVLNDNGKLTGYNTDWIGAIVALEKRVNLKGKKVAVIGAGGAGRAIVYGLIKKGAIVKIFNRSIVKAKELSEEFGCEYAGLDSLNDILTMDIIINATSVGMNEDKETLPSDEGKETLPSDEGKSPIDKNLMHKGQIVMDVVYSPKETRLLKDAKEKGAKRVYGYEMLLYQGVEQFKLYTGLEAPVDEMRRFLENKK